MRGDHAQCVKLTPRLENELRQHAPVTYRACRLDAALNEKLAQFTEPLESLFLSPPNRQKSKGAQPR